ncbi:MAG: sulfopyruvate decarboxylase subunit beta [Candidatus Sulfobium sp.]
MQYPEEELIDILKKTGVDFTASLPCEKIKGLLTMVGQEFFHVPLTREEEGVGICAGAALAGKRPAMFVQSSGVGNMINALLSLTVFYELPLAVFVSRRGIYKEKIEAQVPMGERLPGILGGAALRHTAIDSKDDLGLVKARLEEVYGKDEIHVFLLSPALWEESCAPGALLSEQCPISTAMTARPKGELFPRLTRYEIIKTIAPYIDSRVVACNLGFPSKELFSLKHQPSNFYMLGSMGMVTPIGLGLSLSTDREVIVIDGDGSLLMNPGTLATAAHSVPPALTILAVDNSAYGSTGSQPTLTGSCVDLELVARGFGIKNTVKVSTEEEIVGAIKASHGGLRFIHVLALPGNEAVPNIPLHHLEIKKQFQESLRKR